MTGLPLLLGLLTVLSLPSVSECREPQEIPYIQHHAYNALVDSKRCKVSGTQGITCTYTIGDTLAFSIDGVVEFDATVTFDFVSTDSPYYARFGSRPGCVLIQRKSSKTIDPIEAMSDLAYVSLRNGKVYNNWPDCKEGQ